jgi:hypothetical protein
MAARYGAGRMLTWNAFGNTKPLTTERAAGGKKAKGLKFRNKRVRRLLKQSAGPSKNQVLRRLDHGNRKNSLYRICYASAQYPPSEFSS